MAEGLNTPPRLNNDQDGRMWSFLNSLRNVLQTLTGSGDGRAITLDDLQQAAANAAGSKVGAALQAIVTGTPQGGGPTDMTPPPAPTGFTATQGDNAVLIEFDAGVYAAGNGHAKTIVYAAPVTGTQTFANASVVAEGYAGPFAVPIQTGDSFAFWIRHQSHDEQVNDVMAGPVAGGLGGLIPTPGLIQSAKFAAVSVARLIGGTMSVGQFIQSSNFNDTLGTGWRLDSSTGQLKANFAVLRGAVYANAGQIGGNTIGADYIQATTFNPGVSGWRLNADGTAQIGGLQVTETGIQNVGAGTGGGGFVLSFDGSGRLGLPSVASIDWTPSTVSITSPKFSLSAAGNATFSGDITGATGEFSGRLRAETLMDALLGNVITSEYTAFSASGYTITVPEIAPGVATTSVRLTVIGGGGGASCASSSPDGGFFYGAGGRAAQVFRTVVNDLAVGGIITVNVGRGGLGGQYGSGIAQDGQAGEQSLVRYQPNAVAAYAQIGSAVGGASIGTQGTSNSGVTYGASNGNGTRGRGGNGWPDQDTPTPATGSVPAVNGGNGFPGYVLVEFFDKNTVVMGSKYAALISWLDTLGFGAVPTNAR